jgi:hypothetical protein
MKETPLILDAPPGHSTYDLVEQRFKRAWGQGNSPTIKKIFKVIENKSFLMPYDRYNASATKCSDIMEHARLAL